MDEEVGSAILKLKVDASGYVTGFSKGKAEQKKFLDSAKETVGTLSGLWITVASSAVVAFATKSIAAFAKAERAQNTLLRSTRHFANGLKDADKQMLEFIETNKILTRFTDDELRESLNQTIIKTGDVAKGMMAASAAMDFVAGGGAKTLAEATDMVTAALRGDERGIRSLAVAMGIGGDKAKDASYVFGRLAHDFQGLAQKEDDAAKQMKNFGEQWEDIEEISGKIIVSTGMLKDFTKTLQGLAKFLESGTAAKIGSAIKTVFLNLPTTMPIKLVHEYLNSLAPVTKEHSEGAKKAADWGESLKKAAKDAQAAVGSTTQLDERLKQLESSLDIFNATQDEFLEKLKANSEMVVGPVSEGFRGFFESVMAGNATLQESFDALWKGFAKGALNAIATVLEQKAVEAMVTAGASAVNPLTAAFAGLFTTSAGIYAAGAGTMRGIAAGLANGGMITVPGTPSQFDRVPAMLRPGEVVADLNTERGRRNIQDAVGGGPSVIIQNFHHHGPGGVQGGRQAARGLATTLDKLGQRTGKKFF